MAALLWAIGAAPAFGADDPLNSPAWHVVRERFFPGPQVVFDDRVQVLAPLHAENPLAVPVTVDARGLSGVREVVVVADLNPIQQVLRLRPVQALPVVSFRFKVEQSTPIRAAALTQDGVWHLGGVWLSAAGGGCTTPSGASRGLWHGQVGAMNGRLWRRDGNLERLRLRVVHPMDTGLANGIPAFYMNHLEVHDAGGVLLASLDAFEPVAENPVISLDLRGSGRVRVDGRDIQGDRFAADVAP